MKLTKIQTAPRGADRQELILEFDGVHYEAEWFLPGTDAADVAARLRFLAARIERRAAHTAEGIPK